MHPCDPSCRGGCSVPPIYRSVTGPPPSRPADPVAKIGLHWLQKVPGAIQGLHFIFLCGCSFFVLYRIVMKIPDGAHALWGADLWALFLIHFFDHFLVTKKSEVRLHRAKTWCFKIILSPAVYTSKNASLQLIACVWTYCNRPRKGYMRRFFEGTNHCVVKTAPQAENFCGFIFAFFCGVLLHFLCSFCMEISKTHAFYTNSAICVV